MGNLFNPEGGLMTLLSRLFDLLILNLLTILLCIPIITAGAAVTALHQMVIRMVEGRDTYLVKPYFKCFIENLKNSTLSWLIMLVMSILMYVDFRICQAMGGNMQKVIYVLLLCAAFVFILVFQYVFPLQAHYVNNIRTTFSNAVRVSIGFLPRSVAMLAIQIAAVLLVLQFIQYLLPFALLFGFSGVAFLMAKIYVPIFRKLDPHDETDNHESDSAGDADLIEQRILERQIPGRTNNQNLE